MMEIIEIITMEVIKIPVSEVLEMSIVMKIPILMSKVPVFIAIASYESAFAHDRSS